MSFLLDEKKIRKQLSNNNIFQTKDGYLIDNYISKNLKDTNDQEISIMIETLENAKQDSEGVQNKFISIIAIFIAILTMLITSTITIYGSLFSSFVPEEVASDAAIFSIYKIIAACSFLGISYFIIFFSYYIYIMALREKRSKLIRILKLAVEDKKHPN